jgi:SAM-dependent methyltransferase
VNRPRRRPTQPGRAALALYADSPLDVRAHVHVRWWSAPFTQVAAELPRSGRILEIGCGHGLFAAFAALSEPGRTVLGVDIDADKIHHAQAATSRAGAAWPAEARGAGHTGSGEHLTFAVASSGAVPPGPWDAVAIVDMLYLLPAIEQRRLLTEAVAELAPGGRLVVKELGTHPRWKFCWNNWQESLSVRVLRITEGSSFDFVAPDVMAGWLQDLGLTTTAQRLDHGRMHPHHLLVGRRKGLLGDVAPPDPPCSPAEAAPSSPDA